MPKVRAIIGAINKKQLNKNTEMTFSVLTNLDNFVHDTLSRATATTPNTMVSFDKFEMPDEAFQCLPEGCPNSGTLTAVGAVITGTGIQTQIRADSTDFAAGILTFYIYAEVAGDISLTIGIRDIFTAGEDVRNITVTAHNIGWIPVVIDLAELPETPEWIPSANGVIVRIQRNFQSGDTPRMMISTLRIFNSIEDFYVNDVVKLRCLDDISGDDTLDVINSCLGSTYDTTDLTVERTVTAGLVTPNWNMLNPMEFETLTTEGWYLETVKRHVEKISIEGETYYGITLPDISFDECGFTMVQRNDNCKITDSMLRRIHLPTPHEVMPNEFQILQGSGVADQLQGFINVSPSLEGELLIISYPRHSSVEEWASNIDNVGRRRYRMSYPVVLSDRTELVYVYDNVMITSFPQTLSGSDATSFAFTMNIARDQDGDFFKRRRIIND